jgi:tripartite ATP-independent transporter DctP family solute receptor
LATNIILRPFLAVLALASLLAATSAGYAQQVRLRLGHDQPVGSMYDEGHGRFRKLAQERSGGRLRVDIFPAAQLGSEVAMIEGVRLGSLDGSVAHVANAATVVPELALFSVSYLFKDREHYERVVNDPKFQSRIETLVASKKLGLRVVGFYSSGVRDLYTRRGPATTPEELKGTKIRVMNNPVEARIWSTFGTIPTPMNFGEVYQALQSGVLDAAENAPAVIEANRHYEAARTIILTDHQRSICLLMLSERKLQAMPDDLRRIVLEAAREAATFERERDLALNAEAIERMRGRGAQIVQPDRAKFAARIAPIQDEVARSLGMTDVLELIRTHAR